MSVLTYEDWNEAVGRYCFNPGNAGLRIRFAIDPIVLQVAAAEGQRRHHFASPETAADDFRAAVSQRIDRFGWELGRSSPGRIPQGLAKLGLQVLAVFGVAADDLGGSSYWAALWETLGREVGKRGVKPDDLDLETHQQNWRRLVDWSNSQNRGYLGILPEPDPSEGGRRHVRLPLSHGLLRLEDIQGLHRYFDRIRIAPGEEIEPDELLQSLREYADDASVFRGAHARRVLQDERLPLAAAQIANAVAQWDGQCIDLTKSRGLAVRLWLSVTRRDTVRMIGGLVQLDPRGTAIDVPGLDLSALLTKRSTVRNLITPVSYRPIDNKLVVAVRSHLDQRYIESRYFRPDDRILLARHDQSDGERFTQQLRRLAVNERVEVINHGTDGSLTGWVLYRLHVWERVSERDVPAALAGRLKLTGLRLRVAGGLRVKGAWIEGAGPTLTVLGGESETVIVDGVEHRTADGILHPERCSDLGKCGVHEAWLPGHHRHHIRFRVIHPTSARFRTPTVAAGWARRESLEWPVRMQDVDGAVPGQVRGPVVEGDWPRAQSLEPVSIPVERIAVELALALRDPRIAGRRSVLDALGAVNLGHPNLLVRQLARALRPCGTNRTRPE